VGPLLALAGTLLTGRMMALRGGGLADVAGLSAANGTEEPESVVSLCTDYQGLVSGVRVGLGNL
jgi:hypothetical protein